jgi:hypothetical protein
MNEKSEYSKIAGTGPGNQNVGPLAVTQEKYGVKRIE